MEFPQIVVGTYEEFVLGYKPQIDSSENGKFKLLQTFATHSHQASVRCVAAHEQLMASSGADEYINIYDMNAMEVSTVINYHNATVTCLEFTPDGSHLVTANQNGDIAIFRCKDWNLVKLWKGAHKHSNGVIGMSIHPSGSLLLTSGADNIIRFWNLIKGRQAYATNFSKKCSLGNSLNFGLWSKSGKFYVVCIGNKLEVYKMETAGIIYEIVAHSKITCASFTKKNLLCIGTEEGIIEIHSVLQKKLLIKEEAHKTRVKTISSFSINKETSEKNIIQNYVVSADSKGLIKLWSIKKKGSICHLNLKSEIDCDCRITCLTPVTPKDVKREKTDTNILNSSKTIDKIPIDNVTKESISNSGDKIADNCIASVNEKIILKKGKQKTIETNFQNNNQTNNVHKKEEKTNLDKKNHTQKEEVKNFLKRKARSFSESDCSLKKKRLSSGISNSSKKFKKKKFNNSFTSARNLSSRISGKWSVEDEK